ncbi:hypothetical protein NQ315_017445 [Exocentrus adspersus]|uniref:Uncharacterized protein n=1 Tax=Exocentrus adspersus TaxID=1586481 RepID=A0AAV8VKM2_9CUCU|nr:hypothetical protein NQ315_017445 [Exocentrus adspersus]
MPNTNYHCIFTLIQSLLQNCDSLVENFKDDTQPNLNKFLTRAILGKLNDIPQMLLGSRLELDTWEQIKTVLTNAFGNDEGLEQLIAKVCSTFVKQLEARIDKKFNSISTKLEDLGNSFKTLNESVIANKRVIDELAVTIDYLEQSAKNNTLRFCGIEESKDVKDMDLVLSCMQSKLGINCSPSEVDYVFRAGKFVNGGRPRPMIVRFLANIKKAEVYSSKKLLKDSGITVFEDLSKRRYQLLQQAKKKFGKSAAWSAGGKIYVLANNKKCQINSATDL